MYKNFSQCYHQKQQSQTFFFLLQPVSTPHHHHFSFFKPVQLFELGNNPAEVLLVFDCPRKKKKEKREKEKREKPQTSPFLPPESKSL